MQQKNGMQKFLFNSLNRANIQSNPIQCYMESGIMIKYLKKKFKEYPNQISEHLCMSNKDIDNCSFTKDQFRKLINLYVMEKNKDQIKNDQSISQFKNMVRDLKNKDIDVIQLLGISNDEIALGRFTKAQFRKLLNFYISEKVQ